ncbi:hypothetical protein L596_009759 [Steinernema carpocapsae]|uniref:Uncharacterized protein n=1 Tax=Steinernema carpocapsae TaxID=34508 RepID=A0A4U5PG98_STECR|nr:hypothetical protein L596_009759 [Steinernema carpocapsae]
MSQTEVAESADAPKLKYTILNPSLTKGKMKMMFSSDEDGGPPREAKPRSRHRFRHYDVPRAPIPKESYPVALQKPQFVLPPPEPEAPLLPLEGIRELIKMTIVNREQPVEDPKKKDKEDLELMELLGDVEDALQNTEEVSLGSSADGKPIHLAVCINDLNHIVLVLTHDVSVEISANRQVRMCIDGKAACTMDEEGRLAGVHHPKVELIWAEQNMLLDVRGGPKIRVSDESSIHIWASQNKSTPTKIFSLDEEHPDEPRVHRDFHVASDNFALRTEGDFTVGLFLEKEAFGLEMAEEHDRNRRHALYSIRTSRFIQNGEFVMYLVGGVKVRHSLITGDTRVYVNHNVMCMKCHSLAMAIQSPFIDFTIDRAWLFRAILGERCIESVSDEKLEVKLSNDASKTHVFDMVDVGSFEDL